VNIVTYYELLLPDIRQQGSIIPERARFGETLDKDRIPILSAGSHSEGRVANRGRGMWLARFIWVALQFV
jgi:hypothetical protein